MEYPFSQLLIFFFLGEFLNMKEINMKEKKFVFTENEVKKILKNVPKFHIPRTYIYS